MDADLLHGFYLGDLFVEPLKGQVTDRTGSRHLPPKAAEILLCLAREPGELVTRDHLLECAWTEDQARNQPVEDFVARLCQVEPEEAERLLRQAEVRYRIRRRQVAEPAPRRAAPPSRGAKLCRERL